MGGFSAVLATVVAFAVTFLLGFWAIPFLKRLHFGQTILEDGPKWHQVPLQKALQLCSLPGR